MKPVFLFVLSILIAITISFSQLPSSLGTCISSMRINSDPNWPEHLNLHGAVLGKREESARPAFETTVAEFSGMQSFPVAVKQLGLPSKALTVAVSLRPGALATVGILARVMDGRRSTAIVLEVVHIDAKQSAGSVQSQNQVQFSVTTDFGPQASIVGLPVDLLDVSKSHDLYLRYVGYRIDLFVDGVLADEEWPIGKLAASGTRLIETRGRISKIAIWSNALQDQEIKARNGGNAEIALRTNAMFGPEASQPQYWRPRGYNTSAGDAMPFFHDGVFHVYFLLDRRHHRSKLGLGAHQWGHFSSTDLLHWKNYPAALTISQEWEGSICTGSVIFDRGKFYAFYATRMPDRSERLGMAESDDGILFEKRVPTPFEEPKSPFKRGPNRDPFVFGKEGDYHMLVTATLLNPARGDRAGAIEHLTSADLKAWKAETAPFFLPGYAADPECSDLFFGADGITCFLVKVGQRITECLVMLQAHGSRQRSMCSMARKHA